MPIRAVYDANVVISGLVFAGVPGKCLDAIEDGRVECIICPSILSDVTEKLHTKFGHQDEHLADEIAWLVHNTVTVYPEGHIRNVSRDADDDAAIESAVISGASYIVTGDRDLLSVGQYQNVQIVTPADFLTRVLAP